MNISTVIFRAAQSDFVPGSAFLTPNCACKIKTSTTGTVPYIPAKSYAWTEAKPSPKLCIADSQSEISDFDLFG